MRSRQGVAFLLVLVVVTGAYAACHGIASLWKHHKAAVAAQHDKKP